MKQRIITWLLVLTFVAFATGAAAALHHHDAHFKAGCETCFLLVTAAVGLITAATFFIFIAPQARRIAPVPVRVRSQQPRRGPASPRAPPQA